MAQLTISPDFEFHMPSLHHGSLWQQCQCTENGACPWPATHAANADPSDECFNCVSYTDLCHALQWLGGRNMVGSLTPGAELKILSALI